MQMTKAEFINYLQEILIPDLRESGSEATALDFEAAVRFMQGSNRVFIDNDENSVYDDPDASGPNPVREQINGKGLYYLASPESKDYIEVGSCLLVDKPDNDLRDVNNELLPVGSVVVFPH